MTRSARPPSAAPSRTRLALLLGLLAVLLVVWLRMRPAAPAPSASNPQAAGTAGALVLPEPVKLPALDAVPESAGIGRNPFSFGVRPAPPPPMRAPAPQTGPPPPPPPPSGPPPIGLRVTGMTQVPGSNRTMVTLKDPATGMIFQAFEGDIVDGRYRLVKVGTQSVVVSYLDGTGVRTLPLGG